MFKVQLEDQAMQKLSDRVEVSVRKFRGVEKTNTYTPIQMMVACKEIYKEILDGKDDFGDRELIKKIKEKMEETFASRNEIIKKMLNFVKISFFNVTVALISILLTQIFIKHVYIGGIALIANVYLSIFNLTLVNPWA